MLQAGSPLDSALKIRREQAEWSRKSLKMPGGVEKESLGKSRKGTRA